MSGGAQFGLAIAAGFIGIWFFTWAMCRMAAAGDRALSRPATPPPSREVREWGRVRAQEAIAKRKPLEPGEVPIVLYPDNPGRWHGPRGGRS